MKATIRGMGWVTPLGRNVAEVAEQVQAGSTPPRQFLENPTSKWRVPVFRVPEGSVQDAAAFPRLRRSSQISHFALAAAMDAAAQADLTPEQLARTALIFASSDGGVVYTRRFYADIVERGEGTGSPLLFPETVYNAPASHIAAKLGLPGESLTLVGDSATGLQAVQTALEFLATGDADFCLVCAAQELDWVTSEAYQRWRSLEGASEAAPFSEGAAALLLARDGAGPEIHCAQPDSLPQPPALLVSSRAGTRQDEMEAAALRNLSSNCPVLAPKFFLGESFACTALQQVILGAWEAYKKAPAGSALVTTVGFDGQLVAVFLTQGNYKA